MATFSYLGKYTSGQTVSGVVEASTIDEAKALLRERALQIVSLKEKTQTGLTDIIQGLLHRITAKDVTFFSRQFSVLINASIPVVRALKTLTRQTTNTRFMLAIADIAAAVEGGAKLSQAMAHYPKVFDQFFVHMIRAGETTGRLDQVLEYLADEKEKDYALKSRIRGAMIYPAVILTAMVGIGSLMMIYVVPTLADVITQGGGKLPWTTKLLLTVSFVMSHYWWLILFLLAVAGVSIYLYAHTVSGLYYIDHLKLKLPVLGKLNQQIALTRFAVSLSNLLASGVPVTRSLEITADIVNNTVYRELIMKAVVEVQGGNPIAGVFMHQKNIPSIVPQMIAIGEETGKLDEILKKLAAFYSREIDSMLGALTSLIEPLVIIMLGIGAAIIVTGILLPIYSATNAVGSM